MGDGRYYTFYQFFSVSLLVILSMSVIASMLIGYYRNEKNENAKKIFDIFFVLVLTICLKIVELVIPHKNIGYTIRCFDSAIIFIMITYLLSYLNRSVFKVFRVNDKPLASVLSVILFTITIITKGRAIISKYDFFNTQFSVLYLALLLIVLLITLIYLILILRAKKQVHNIYSNIVAASILTFSILTPVLIYFFMIILRTYYLDFAEILIYISLGIMLNVIAYSQSPSGLNILAFDRIGDIIHYYIFVTDKYGKFIYKNMRANKSDFFVNDEKIDISNIKNIYKNEPHIKQNKDGNEYAKLKYKDANFYFTHKHRYLKDDGKIIGHIITITDITDLMNLLYSLEDRKKKSEQVNLKLKNYSKVVYHIEKEKEINALLEEIVSSREKEMENLIDMINCINGVDEIFESKIDGVIDFNQRILEDVRKAVSAYRQHYGG